jgi:hypothetical protein
MDLHYIFHLHSLRFIVNVSFLSKILVSIGLLLYHDLGNFCNINVDSQIKKQPSQNEQDFKMHGMALGYSIYCERTGES